MFLPLRLMIHSISAIQQYHFTFCKKQNSLFLFFTFCFSCPEQITITQFKEISLHAHFAIRRQILKGYRSTSFPLLRYYTINSVPLYSTSYED